MLPSSPASPPPNCSATPSPPPIPPRRLPPSPLPPPTSPPLPPLPLASLGLRDVSPTSLFLHLASNNLPPPASPAVRVNGRPWPMVIPLLPSPVRDTVPSKPSAPPAPSLRPALLLFIYGLEPSTAYTIELDLADQLPQSQSQSESESDSGSEPDRDRDRDASIAGERPSERPTHCGSRLVAAARAFWHTGPRAEPTDSLARRALPMPKTRPALPMPSDHDGPPPPYTSHDPASPCSPQPSPAPSPLVTLLRPSSPPGADPLPSADSPPAAAAAPPISAAKEAKMRARIDEQRRELEEAVAENPRLKAQLAALELAIRRLDGANGKKADELTRLQALTGALEQQTARQEAQLRKRQTELEGVERRQAKGLGEMEERGRVLRGRWEDSQRRLDELKAERLPAIETEIGGLAKMVSQLDAQIAAESLPAAVVWPPLKGQTSSPSAPARAHRWKCRSTDDFGQRTILASKKAQPSERSHTDPSTTAADQPRMANQQLPAPTTGVTIWTNQTQRMTCSLRRGSSLGDKRARPACGARNEQKGIVKTWAKVAGT